MLVSLELFSHLFLLINDTMESGQQLVVIRERSNVNVRKLEKLDWNWSEPMCTFLEVQCRNSIKPTGFVQNEFWKSIADSVNLKFDISQAMGKIDTRSWQRMSQQIFQVYEKYENWISATSEQYGTYKLFFPNM